ncbi:MAG TPA: single-stranded-DNA-specific exonuclease RecJ [Aeromonadales bacterium]|nr:single-stranded-DNA-specific exonuclease RecJ [Aeromonadales bacterium]
MTTIVSQRKIPQASLDWSQWPGHPLLKRIYAARKIQSFEALDLELSQLLKFKSLQQIDQAVELLYKIMQQDGLIIIVGDFDTDGATSTTLVMEIMQAFGHNAIDYLVPNRFDFGYGLSEEIVEVAARDAPALIITVDNGIANHAGVAKANSLGIPVLITDHHLPAETLPQAAAIVNPNVEGDEFPSKALAGVGVAFYLMLALRAYLKEKNWFEERNISMPNLGMWLDLVAVGTVADMVPLDENNRRLVAQGLKRIRAGQCRPGIKALLELAKKNLKRTSAMDIGFAIGPRLNAAGRLDDMSIGIQCLMEKDPSAARAFAVELDQLNLMRREIETSMQQEALTIVNQLLASENFSILPDALSLFHPEWHQGVVGLVASRIKEKFHRPVIAFALEGSSESDPSKNKPGDGGAMLKGSARSIPGVHIRDALVWVDTQHPGLIAKFGGHAMAAGLTLAKENLAVFEQALKGAVREQLGEEEITNKIETDGELEPEWMNLETANLLAESGPWGQHFPEPNFDGIFEVVQQRIVGVKHLKLVLKNNLNQYIDAIAFNIDPAKWQQVAEKVRIVYRPDINEFRGETKLQFMVQYIERVE